MLERATRSGQPALAQLNDGRSLALVEVQPVKSADLPYLVGAYSRLYTQFLTQLPSGEWDGSPLRVVLTQRIGKLWDLCVGMEGAVDRWLEAGCFAVHLSAQGEVWNYWNDICIEDETYPDRWLAAAQSLGYVLQVIRAGEEAGTTFLQHPIVRIPAAAVIVRRRG